MNDSQPHLFCFGLGYSAQILANLLMDKGWHISGTHRPHPREDAVVDVETLPFERNLALQGFDQIFKNVTHVLISIPPDAAGCPVLDLHGEDIARHAPHIQWVGYLSTVGVYGNTDGRPVNETSRLLPTQERSRFRGLAETRWQNLAVRTALKLSVFRLAGIYGPGRNPFEKIRQGKAQRISMPNHLFSRIHVNDIANVLSASINNPHLSGIYNVCDDEPAAPSDVIKYACELLNEPVPVEISFAEASKTMSPMAQSFWADNRLILNDKIKEKLGVELLYAHYQQGLESILTEEQENLS